MILTKHTKKISKFVLYRPRYELNKIMWEFNPYDTDTNPHLSIPHGDDYSPTYHSLKLNVDSGIIYTSRNRRNVGKIDKKELLRLHRDKGFQKVKEEALMFRNGEVPASLVKASCTTYKFELNTKIMYHNIGE